MVRGAGSMQTFPKKGGKNIGGALKSERHDFKGGESKRRQQQQKGRNKGKNFPQQKAQPQFFEAQESSASSDEDAIQEIPMVNLSRNNKKAGNNRLASGHIVLDSDQDDVEPVKKQTKQIKKDELPTQSFNDDLDDIEDEEMQNEEESDSNEDEAEKFREEIANLPLAKVRELRDQLGLKLFNKLYFSKSEKGEKNESTKEKMKEIKKKEKNSRDKVGKNAPREISSKKPVSALRNVYKNEKLVKKKWDPRFDERAGALKEDCFDANYEFLNDIRQDERQELRKELVEAYQGGDEEKSARIGVALERMENQERARKDKEIKKAAMAEIRQENIDRMLNGQRPIFKTKAQVRMKIEEKKFEHLKKEKRLDKFFKNKSKKQAEREKKKKAIQKNAFEAKYGYQ